MPDPFIATDPFIDADFPNAGRQLFPIIEVLGYDRHLLTEEARASFNLRHCPFANRACEKYQQYGFGYCSVQYKSKYDKTAEVYAVCDHRLDGAPVRMAVDEFFGPGRRVVLLEEVKLTNPDQSFDFIAIDPDTDDFIVIETQAIDLRGGGVGPAWQSMVEGEPADWRAYFSREATQKNRKDNIAYGVNMANITKRLGFQVADKGSLLNQLKAKLYVIAQHKCFQYFRQRIPADWTTDQTSPWDITFLSFDYTGSKLSNGMWELAHVQSTRTTYASFSEALARSTASISREEFLRRIKQKTGSSSVIETTGL